jgi:hypothetical protein
MPERVVMIRQPSAPRMSAIDAHTSGSSSTTRMVFPLRWLFVDSAAGMRNLFAHVVRQAEIRHQASGRYSFVP